MNRLKWVAGLVVHNFGWKMLALAIAFVIWVLVASEPELSTFATVPVEYRDLPNDLDIASRPVETVTLELRGPAGELSSERRPSVVLDMSHVMAGQYTFPIAGPSVNLARGVRLVRAIPSEVRFDFERRLARRIPVQVRFTGLPAGYVIEHVSISPDSLGIVGPANRVAPIKAATTDPVNVSGVVGAAEFHVNAYLPDLSVSFEGSPEVTVTATVAKR
jgi:YbbR domain-containing protein